jgi:molybdopterin-guanine dinucleotide biosynthesis protein B
LRRAWAQTEIEGMRVIGFAGYSGSGKTTLIERLVPHLTGAGLRVSLVKHAHHDFDIDQPGKDSYRHRQAGCTEVLVGSARRWALVRELRDEPEPGLEELLGRLSDCDLVLVEGWKHAAIPKIEVHRQAVGAPLLAASDPHVLAVASDRPAGDLAAHLPRDVALFGLDAVEALARFAIERSAMYRA